MTALRLYTTSHCHLCEKAQALVMALTTHCSIHLQLVEICADDELIAKYGVRIPVIQRVSDQTEMDWPFSSNDILLLLDTE